MYAVKVLHGYLTYTGKRTRDKTQAKRYIDKQAANQFANLVGGRVKKIE